MRQYTKLTGASTEGIFIADLVEGGVAHTCGSLEKGDQLMAANGISLEKATQVFTFTAST